MAHAALQIAVAQSRRALCPLLAQINRSSTSAASAPEAKDGKKEPQSNHNNQSIMPCFFNRNPRNLEKMYIARKPVGYHLDKPGHEFWHKLTLKVSQSGVTADIVHNSGTKVVSVSTTEFALQKFLYRPSDCSAYQALGKVLARRCLESGIHHVTCDINAAEGTNVDALLKQATQNGLSFTEPKVYVNPARWGQKYTTKPWDVIT